MDLNWLLQQPEKARDQAWEESVLRLLCETKVQLQSETPQEGPDGWPYLFVRTGTEGAEPFVHVVQWLARRGIGLVVNPHKMLPDYIFSYGMLWNFVETGRFISPSEGFIAAKNDSPESSRFNWVMGAPTEKYLPSYVREILKSFLAQQGYANPKILVASQAPEHKLTDLIFSIEALNHLQTKDQKVMAEAVGWFLPLHYNLVFASEKGLPEFVDL